MAAAGIQHPYAGAPSGDNSNKSHAASSVQRAPSTVPEGPAADRASLPGHLAGSVLVRGIFVADPHERELAGVFGGPQPDGDR